MAKKKEVVITCNATNVKAVIEGLERGMAALAHEEEKLLNTIKQRGYAEDAEKKRLKELEKGMDSMRTVIAKDKEELKKYGEVMKDLAGAKTKELKKALQEVKNALNNMSAKDPGRQRLINDMKRIQAQIEQNTGAIKKQQSAFGALGTTMKNLFAYAGIFAGFNRLKSMIEEVFKANTRLSDSLANIRKVSGLSMSEINQLYANISKIDSRNTIETLNQLAYTGAKLGIGQNYGVQGLTGFVKAAEQVQMALGEDMGEKALPELAKMTEVMGLIDKYGVEQAMQKAASAIFQLGATSTATGTNIVEFSKRLYGLANVSRVSADELLAVGSAADAMGLMPEVAATAFNKLFTSVQKNHNLIEKTLDLPKGRINYWFEQGKTINAIVEIFEAMNKRGNMNALDGVFKDLGSEGARLINVMATMADRVDILKKHLDTSNKAFKEGEAVIAEYMIQNETAAALMERASNLWAKAFTNPEGVSMVQELAKAWYDLSKEMVNNKSTMMGLKLSIDGIALAIRSLISLAPFFLKAFSWAGVLMIIRSVGFGIAGLVAQLRAASGAAMTLQVILKSNWVLAGVSAAAAVITMFVENLKAAEWEAEELRKHQAELDRQLAQSKDTIEQTIRPLERYKKSLDQANYSEEERNKLLREYLAGNYQDYLDYLGIEIDKTLDLAKAYNMVVKTMKQKKAYEERESYRDTVNGQNRMDRIAAGMEFEREAKRFGLEGIDRAWIAKNQGTNTKDLYMQLMRQRYGNDVQLFNWENLKDVTLVKRSKKGKGGVNILYGEELGDLDLWNAIYNYQVAYRTERNLNRDVDDMFKDMVGDYDPDKWDKAIMDAKLKRKGSLENEKPDKAALAAARKAQQDAKQAARKDLKDLQERSTGILSKLEEYYRLQEAAINEARADGQLTEDQTKEMVRSLNIFKNESLATARRAIVTGDTTDWDRVKNTILPTVLSDTSEVSRDLLKTIQDVLVDKLHTDLAKFNGSEGVFGLSSRAFFDQISAKAAGNEREAARLRAKIQNEVEKALLQYQFVEKANQQMRKDVENMGITTETYEQWARRMQAGITKKPDTQLANGRTISDEQAYRRMGNKFVDMGSINFRFNIENEAEAMEWIQQFATTAEGELEDWAQAFPQLVEWIDLIKRKEQGVTLGEAEVQSLQEAMPVIRNLFNEMMNHADRLDKAMKDAYQHEKTMQESRFRISGLTDQETQGDKYYAQKSKQEETGAGQSFAKMLGLGKIANDPEILQIQNRIYWRNKEVEDARSRLEKMKAMQDEEIAKLRETNATKEEIAAKEKEFTQDRAGLEQLLADRQTELAEQENLLATKAMQEMQKRVAAVKDIVKPFSDAANNIGKKLGDMIRGAEEDSITWEEIWKNMLLAVAESMIQMGAQYAENLIMQQSYNRASEAETIGHTTTEVTAGIAAGSAKTIGELGWWGIPLIAIISSLLMGLLQAALSTTKSNNKSSSKIKLVSGMLTYDEGNVGQYVGNDGHVYSARQQSSLPEGVSLVQQPIATTVNGQPSLVAEKGPEIVIGRRTTRQIMMNEPGLIRTLANYGRGGVRRLYDEGNLSEVVGLNGEISPQGRDDNRAALDGDTVAALKALPGVLAQLNGELARGIQARVAKFGDGSLDEGMRDVESFRKRYPRES